MKKKDEDLKEAESHREAEGVWKEAKEPAEKNAKMLEESRSALLACMEEAKVALDAIFAKAGAEQREVLPNADLAAFSAWL